MTSAVPASAAETPGRGIGHGRRAAGPGSMDRARRAGIDRGGVCWGSRTHWRASATPTSWPRSRRPAAASCSPPSRRPSCTGSGPGTRRPPRAGPWPAGARPWAATSAGATPSARSSRTSPTGPENLQHIHSVLALCGLPYRDPGDAREFFREYGRNSLSLLAGRLKNPRHRRDGVPGPALRPQGPPRAAAPLHRGRAPAQPHRGGGRQPVGLHEGDGLRRHRRRARHHPAVQGAAGPAGRLHPADRPLGRGGQRQHPQRAALPPARPLAAAGRPTGWSGRRASSSTRISTTT